MTFYSKLHNVLSELVTNIFLLEENTFRIFIHFNIFLFPYFREFDYHNTNRNDENVICSIVHILVHNNILPFFPLTLPVYKSLNHAAPCLFSQAQLISLRHIVFILIGSMLSSSKTCYPTLICYLEYW